MRGTPGSGKSVLAQLLGIYIQKKEPDTILHYHSAWLRKDHMPTYPSGSVLILDEAQTTYWDKAFWNKFKNPELQGERVVTFASHGSSGYTGADSLTPMFIAPEQHVGLTPVDCGDRILVGLLFTKEEFEDLAQVKFGDDRFCPSFLDCVFDMTQGHVGACMDIMRMIKTHRVDNTFICFVLTRTDGVLVIS